MLHPADEGQMPETAAQGLHFLSFGIAYMIFLKIMTTSVFTNLCIKEGLYQLYIFFSAVGGVVGSYSLEDTILTVSRFDIHSPCGLSLLL